MNGRTGRWPLTLIGALIVALSVIVAAESYWRDRGFTPTLLDSRANWSLHRHRASRPGDEVVFLGASRTLYGIDLPTVERCLSGRRAHMLALNGRYPLATLRDLAADQRFTGTVIIDVDARGLSAQSWDHQQEHVDYYHEAWTPNWRIHQAILNELRQHLVFINPLLSLKELASRRWRDLPPPRASHEYFDRRRMGFLDFAATRPDRLGRWFLGSLEDDLKNHPPDNPENWLIELQAVAEWVVEIESRGGTVIFYVPPVSGPLRDRSLEAYPLESYWRAFVDRYDLKGLHFMDVDALRRIEQPDDSHIDRALKNSYTATLMRELGERGFLAVADCPAL